MHGQGLIHKDVKPANALVDEAGHVWLTGFGIASRLPRERQAPVPPEIIAGTFAYLAPEQTGRMNRSIDSRSDLYALGVTLYQLLTGSLPFAATDPMDWVHCHIARKPVAPSERMANVPIAISAIIMKLLAKAAEERYQTAAGLEHDLRRCLVDWEDRASLYDFRLGQQDATDRLLIPEKLYGRTLEVERLLASFDRVAKNGTPELVLISGYSGIGKSSVVNELHRVLVPPRGLFASGKFDQHQSEIPYATMVQAFQGLIQPLLSTSELDLSKWRADLLQVLGPDGSLILNLVPDLVFIIGEQPTAPNLSPTDARARFQSVFRRFIGVFAKLEHPLALFLDDLQWLDAATLDLIENLLTEPDMHHLLLIGAYRNNEVGPSHPLTRKLKEIRENGVSVSDIILTPLACEDIELLVADALRSDLAEAKPLARLIHAKTGGNPFFSIQFFSNLSAEGLISFDHVEGRWRWNLRGIYTKDYTDNVVDLMVAKLNRLPAKTQMALRQLACIGNSTEFGTLSVCLETTEDEVHADLWEALRLELILRLDGSYKFAHDRIQEAAYSLIPEESRPIAHLRIGRLLVTHVPLDKREDAIFEITGQLNRGDLSNISDSEREQIAELNLMAGRRAKTSTAYASALRYLTAGAALLADECWDQRHDLLFELELHRAECEFLTGAVTDGARRLETLSSRTAGTVEASAVACLRVDLYMTLDQIDRAIAVSLDYLRKHGIEWSPHLSKEEVRREYDRIFCQLKGYAIEDVINLPLIDDPVAIATLNVLSKLVPMMFAEPDLLSLAICRAVAFGLEHGHGDGSCVAYVLLGMIARAHFGDYEAGYQFAQLGYELVEQRGLTRLQAPTYQPLGDRVMPWTKPIKACRVLLHRAFDAATKGGPFTFAVFSGDSITTNILAAGDPLVEAQRQAESGLAFARRARFGLACDLNAPQLALIRTLRGLTPRFGCFDDEEFSEVQFERHVSSNRALAVAECRYWVRKLQARVFAGDYAAAIDASSLAKRLLWTSRGALEEAEYEFYSGLARAAFFDVAEVEQRPQHVAALATHHRRLEEWAQNCPENFENRAALVGAEIARIEGRDFDSMRLYEQAIRSAHANGFVHNEAVANELAGRFYLARGIETAGYAHLNNARNCYDRWGAHGKAKQLDERYPRLRDPRSLASSATINLSVGQLDVETVVRASRALSSEMVLPKLIERLMRIAVEHAGAERGLLILIRDGDPRIEAEATIGSGKIEVAALPAAIRSADMPQTVLQYAIRTQERVLLDDALSDDVHSTDEYVRQKRSRSVLCLPLVKQAKLVGTLYLENNLTPSAFTADRVTVLEMLAAQAAISLENAALYTDLQRSETFLTQGQRIGHIGSFGWSVASGDFYWSEELYNILEYDRNAQASTDLAVQRMHPDDRDGVRRLLEAARNEGKDFESEHRLLMPDGRVKHVHTTGRAVNTAALDFVGAVRDITERVRAEETLRQAQADLAYINRVTTMGELAASLAHELSQPISGAMTNANTCLQQLKGDQPNLDDVRASVARILRDSQRAAEIIGRIRSQFVRGIPRREAVDIDEINREIIALLRDEAVRNTISVRTNLAADLPRIVGDRVQLQQVAMNLIVNSIEATKDVDGVREIVIKSQRAEDDQILVSVSDTGTGFPPQSAEEIFTPFFTTKPQGTGMGLRISRSIIESHGGRLWAESTPGSGATFYLSLPAARKVPRNPTRDNAEV